MKIRHDCPHCGDALHSEVAQRGQTSNCHSCTGEVAVPDWEFGPRYIVGGYLIQRQLDRGGQSQVYLAVHPDMEQPVALKVLAEHCAIDERQVKRFEREIRAQAGIRHPNLVPLYKAGKDDGLHWFSMPFVDGANLATVLKTNGALPEKFALLVAAKAALGLRAAWDAKKLVHRDVKPANLMLDKAGEVKVLDLGLCIVPGDTGLTSLGLAPGTPAYMSPEQRNHESALDFRCDIYALGRTLYHLLTNHRPVPGADTADLATRTPELQTQTLGLVERMTETDPAARHESWEHLLTALMDCLRGAFGADETFVDHSLVETMRLPPALLRKTPWHHKSWVKRAGIALVGLLALALLWAGVRNLPAVKRSKHVVDLGGGVEMQLVKFSDRYERADGTEVKLPGRFWIAKTEVTQVQFTRVLGVNPSRVAGVERETHPVENVTWSEALAFCDALNERDTNRPLGYEYRLPLEFEWERAARGDADDPGGHHRDATGFGPTLALNHANIAVRGDDLNHTTAVASYPSTGKGLFDLHGNVAEWCLDGGSALEDIDWRDPIGGSSGLRAVRGGSFEQYAEDCFTEARAAQFADASNETLGFRLVLGPRIDPDRLTEPAAQTVFSAPDLRDMLDQPAQLSQITVDIGQGEAITFAPIQPGLTLATSNRVPVVVSRPFWIGVTELTQGQYRRFSEKPASEFRDAMRPVEMATWAEAKAYCTELNHQLGGQLPNDYVFRLPTEAEWLHACLAGSETRFWCDGNHGCLFGREIYRRPGSPLRSSRVRSRRANPNGLFDMHGNVAEWCLDDWQEHWPDGAGDPELAPPEGADAGVVEPVIDPFSAAGLDQRRVARGGSWSAFDVDCRADMRHPRAPGKRESYIGFRVVLGPEMRDAGR